MFSILLTLAIFIFWTGLGRALLAVFACRLGVLRSWLISPATGLATLGLCIMVFNQVGMPVKSFALPLTVVLGVLACLGFLLKRPLIPFKALLPFVATTLFSLLWTAWPALKFNFSWISIVNDDFTNYCLAAERFKDFGFYRIPTTAELLGKDYSHYFWFMHVIGLTRFGAEHMLAWMASLTKLPALEIFMPTIMAFSMAQLFSITALVLHSGKLRKVAIWTMIVLAISPMFMFGTLYQLIAQVSGLSLLFCLVTLLTAQFRTRSRLALLGYAVPTAIVGSGLCIFYPEVSPFAVISVGLYYLYRLFKDRVIPGAQIVLLEYTIVGILFILRYNFISYFYMLLHQFAASTERKTDLAFSLFPFFLIPSGLSSIFGLQAMNYEIADPWGSIIIVIGFILLVCCIFYAAKAIFRGIPFAFLFIVELAMAAAMYSSGNDFGLYKMVMFILPLLMASGVSFLLESKWSSLMPYLGFIFFLLTCSTALIYTQGSCGSNVGMISEVSHASELFNARPKAASDGAHWTGTIDNVSAAKVAANLYRNVDMSFICRDYFDPIFATQPDWPYLKYYPFYEQFSLALAMAEKRKTEFFVRKTIFDTSFTEIKESNPPSAYLSQSLALSLFNKLHTAKEEPSLFVLESASAVSNRITFIHSDRGNHYYLGDRHKISYFQQEVDSYGNQTGFNGIGQFMLLRIEQPTPHVYLRVSATKTLMGNGNNTWSTEAKIVGTNTVKLGALGSGALNLIAGPITPFVLNGASYIALDFNQAAIAMPFHRHGIKAFYNSSINLDYRHLVAYGRDISALSPDEVRAIERPRGLGNFPTDIVMAKGLEYSGIYEDGWISPDSRFVLAAAEPNDQLRLKGFIPDIAGITSNETFTIRVNGSREYNVICGPGAFDWAIPVWSTKSATTVEIHSSAHPQLPSPDLRPVTAHISYIGLEDKGVYRYDYSKIDAALPLASHIGSDGWASSDSVITIPVASKTKSIIFKLEYPGWIGIASHAKINLRLNDRPSKQIVLNQGINEIVLPCELGSHQIQVSFETDQPFTLPAPDLRQCAFRLLSITPR